MVLPPPHAALGWGSHFALEPHMTQGRSIFVSPGPAGWPESLPGEMWALEVLDCPQNLLWVQAGFVALSVGSCLSLHSAWHPAGSWSIMKVGIIAVNDLVTVFGLCLCSWPHLYDLMSFFYILLHSLD